MRIIGKYINPWERLIFHHFTGNPTIWSELRNTFVRGIVVSRTCACLAVCKDLCEFCCKCGHEEKLLCGIAVAIKLYYFVWRFCVKT